MKKYLVAVVVLLGVCSFFLPSSLAAKPTDKTMRAHYDENYTEIGGDAGLEVKSIGAFLTKDMKSLMPREMQGQYKNSVSFPVVFLSDYVRENSRIVEEMKSRFLLLNAEDPAKIIAFSTVVTTTVTYVGDEGKADNTLHIVVDGKGAPPYLLLVFPEKTAAGDEDEIPAQFYLCRLKGKKGAILSGPYDVMGLPLPD